MRIRFLLLLALLAVSVLPDSRALATSQARASAALPAVDDVWIISTRRLARPRPCDDVIPEPDYFKRVGCQWELSSADEFYARDDPQRITCFYVHGNRIERGEAPQGGMRVYRRLACEPGATRFVIWSWPSGKIHGLVRDARHKAKRTDTEAFYLANTLARFPDDATVSLIGYSFGGRVVTGSLHLLAGGQLCGNVLRCESLPAYQPRVALVAGAVSNAWLCPHGAHGLAVTKIDRMYLTFNHQDPALKRYHITSKNSQPRALGHIGASSNCLGDHDHLVCQHNIKSIVGRNHGFDKHFNSRAITRRVRHYVLWREVP